jgi:hypothetical protein
LLRKTLGAAAACGDELGARQSNTAASITLGAMPTLAEATRIVYAARFRKTNGPPSKK